MRKFVIIGIIVLVAVGLIYWRISVKNKLKKSTGFSIVMVERKNLTSKVLATGILKPRLKIRMMSPKRGQVDEILVDEGDKVRKGQKLAWISSEDRITLIDAATVNLEKAKESGDKDKIVQAEREWKIAQEAYQRIPLISPIDGKVTLRSVEPGQNVNANTEIIGISDRLVVKTQVDETDIGKIKTGMPAEIVIDAYPENQFYGKVTKIAYESTIVSNVTTYDVTIELTKFRKILKSGMTANVEVILAQRKDVLVLPLKAVKRTHDGKIVLVSTGEKQPQPQEVVTGLENEEEVEIVSGVEEGEEIIITKRTRKDEMSQRPRSLFMPRRPRRKR